MLKQNKKHRKPTNGTKYVFLASILISVFILILANPVSAQGEVIIQIDQPNQYADFTVDSSITIQITGNFTTKNYPGGIVYFGIYSPDGWITSISPEESFMGLGDTVSFEGEITPPLDSTEEEHDIYVWASIDKNTPSVGDIMSSSSDVFSISSIIDVIQNRVKMISDVVEQRILPDTEIIHTFSVTNEATVSDKFFIDLLDDEALINQGWTISQSESNISLEPGETKDFTISQQIPEDSEVGDYEFQVIVSSEGHAASKASQTLVTKVRVPKIGEPLDLTLIFVVGFVGTGIGLAAFLGATEIGYLALLSIFLPLYVRLKKKDVLSHFTRGQIFGYIQANPGAHYNAIIQYLGLHNGVGAYHLKVLEREGYIKSLRDGIYKRFYPKNMRIPEKRLHLSRIQRDILSEIQKHPGITQKEISKLLDESKQVVNYNVKVLESAGLIRMERVGRESSCFAGNIRYIPEEDIYEIVDEKGATQITNA
jgi:DNA-binding MarR family transcriptional regulator